MVILFDQHNMPNDIYEILFATTQQIIVSRVLIHHMKKNKGQLTKSEMSRFATNLNDGKIITEIQEEPFVGKKVKLSYNKRQFYDRILTPMRSMGLINYDLYGKTYKVSDNFNEAVMHITKMWNDELQKEPSMVEFA